MRKPIRVFSFRIWDIFPFRRLVYFWTKWLAPREKAHWDICELERLRSTCPCTGWSNSFQFAFTSWTRANLRKNNWDPCQFVHQRRLIIVFLAPIQNVWTLVNLQSKQFRLWSVCASTPADPSVNCANISWGPFSRNAKQNPIENTKLAKVSVVVDQNFIQSCFMGKVSCDSFLFQNCSHVKLMNGFAGQRTNSILNKKRKYHFCIMLILTHLQI